MSSISFVFCLFLCFTACSTPPPLEPEPSEKTKKDAGQPEQQQQDFTQNRCKGNNDGIIDWNEVQFVAGASANVLRNPPGKVIKVNHAGRVNDNGVRVWDFRNTAADYSAKVKTVDPTGKWFLSSFPKANLLTPTELSGYKGELYQVYSTSSKTLFLEGIASEKEKPDGDKILLPYETPVPLLRFPLREGKEWLVTSKAKGVIQGLPVTSTDRYHIKVAGRGSVILPDIQFDNSLKIVLHVQQRLLGGQSRRLYQVLFMHECYGEIVRIESKENESSESFNQARLLRFISF